MNSSCTIKSPTRYGRRALAATDCPANSDSSPSTTNGRSNGFSQLGGGFGAAAVCSVICAALYPETLRGASCLEMSELQRHALPPAAAMASVALYVACPPARGGSGGSRARPFAHLLCRRGLPAGGERNGRSALRAGAQGAADLRRGRGA